MYIYKDILYYLFVSCTTTVCHGVFGYIYPVKDPPLNRFIKCVLTVES